MGPGEFITSNSACHSQINTQDGLGTIGFYTNSPWVRQNTLLDIDYLKSLTTSSQVAQDELIVTLPQSDERDPLCIGGLPDGSDGRWFPSEYGCQEKNILAIVDYTTGTGTMVTPESEYTKEKHNDCSLGDIECRGEITASCDLGDYLIDKFAGCYYPRIAKSLGFTPIPAGSTSGP